MEEDCDRECEKKECAHKKYVGSTKSVERERKEEKCEGRKKVLKGEQCEGTKKIEEINPK